MTTRALLLAPVLMVQALWVMHRAMRLPEAAGPRRGRIGQGPDCRLLILGDSSAAGVGVARQSDALAGCLAALLAPHVTLHWQVLARSGATVADAPAMLDTLAGQGFDAAVLGLGVNDCKNGRARSRFRTSYGQLLDRLATEFGVARIYASGLPPLQHFPLLPSPLRQVLGQRAALFDQDIRALAAERAGVAAIPMTFDPAPERMARDGFHPGASVYREWAERVAAAFLADP